MLPHPLPPTAVLAAVAAVSLALVGRGGLSWRAASIRITPRIVPATATARQSSDSHQTVPSHALHDRRSGVT